MEMYDLTSWFKGHRDAWTSSKSAVDNCRFSFVTLRFKQFQPNVWLPTYAVPKALEMVMVISPCEKNNSGHHFKQTKKRLPARKIL